jgi:hypothetical protein
MRGILSRLSLPILLYGCAAAGGGNIDVFGKVGPNSERFYGTAIVAKNGSTAIKMTSAAGVECIGDFPYAGRKTRKSDLICTDGRIARMSFTALSRASGYGYGAAGDGTVFAFFFGLSEEEADGYLGLTAPAQ